MLDFTAYLAAQRLTQEAAREALPDAPVRPDRVTTGRSMPMLLLRQRISGTLRRLADLVEPLPEPAKPAVAGCQ